MKTIQYATKHKIVISFDKIKPFYNICKVTGMKEKCNVTLSYIPNKKILEIDSYRNYFDKLFNMYIEEIATTTFEDIWKHLKPKYLNVTVYLEDKKLTPWSVTVDDGTK